MQALSGIASLFVDQQNPQAVGTTISDNVTGMYACYAILGALFERTRTGVGRRLEVNMLESTLAFMPDMVATYTQTGQSPHRFTRSSNSNFYYLRCSDGKLVAVHLSNREKFWQGIVTALKADKLRSDQRFCTHMDRCSHRQALQEALQAYTQSIPILK